MIDDNKLLENEKQVLNQYLFFGTYLEGSRNIVVNRTIHLLMQRIIKTRRQLQVISCVIGRMTTATQD